MWLIGLLSSALVLSVVIALEIRERRMVEREWDEYVVSRELREDRNKERVAAGQRPIPGGGRPEYPSWRKAGG